MRKVLYGEILNPEPAASKARRDENRVRDGFWRKVNMVAARIPIIEEIVAGYFCAIDPSTPSRARYILFGALAYFVLPLDWVPDFLLGLGFTDDIAVLTAAFTAIRMNLKPGHYVAARKALAKLAGRPSQGN